MLSPKHSILLFCDLACGVFCAQGSWLQFLWWNGNQLPVEEKKGMREIVGGAGRVDLEGAGGEVGPPA